LGRFADADTTKRPSARRVSATRGERFALQEPRFGARMPLLRLDEVFPPSSHSRQDAPPIGSMRFSPPSSHSRQDAAPTARWLLCLFSSSPLLPCPPAALSSCHSGKRNPEWVEGAKRDRNRGASVAALACKGRKPRPIQVSAATYAIPASEARPESVLTVAIQPSDSRPFRLRFRLRIKLRRDRQDF